MFKESKYYGEVWFVDKKETKCFCLLTFTNGDVFLETNLSYGKPVYKHQIILGLFTSLGYLTFIDCRIKFNQKGIFETYIYQPKYSFISASHHVETVGLKFKKFQISNDSIVDWVDQLHWYDFAEDKLIKKDDISQTFNINEIGLSLELKQSTSSNFTHKEFKLINNGYLNFEVENEIPLLKAFEYYITFQKLLQFLSAKTKQFTFFSYQCLTCDEWISVYYKEDRFEKSGSSYIHLSYDEISEELPILIKNAYTSTPFMFCLDKLMENLLGIKLNHSRRFTNSISTFEAFNKLFKKHTNTKLTNYLNSNKENIIAMSKMDENEFDDFTSKLIRSRNYHVHSNLDNKNVFSDFELLYISFLLDYTVGLGLMQEINISEEIKNKIIKRGQIVFINMQDTNKILNKDPFIN